MSQQNSSQALENRVDFLEKGQGWGLGTVDLVRSGVRVASSLLCTLSLALPPILHLTGLCREPLPWLTHCREPRRVVGAVDGLLGWSWAAGAALPHKTHPQGNNRMHLGYSIEPKAP